jgi:hypothetical protein
MNAASDGNWPRIWLMRESTSASGTATFRVFVSCDSSL